MFEDCRNQWSMSRPLLGLILLNEDYFQQLRDQVSNDNLKVQFDTCLSILLNLLAAVIWVNILHLY